MNKAQLRKLIGHRFELIPHAQKESKDGPFIDDNVFWVLANEDEETEEFHFVNARADYGTLKLEAVHIRGFDKPDKLTVLGYVIVENGTTRFEPYPQRPSHRVPSYVEGDA
jgi:hypothetical protein